MSKDPVEQYAAELVGRYAAEREAHALNAMADLEDSEGHRMNLTYTFHDEGIHLQCSCGWWVNLGVDASPWTAAKAAAEHAAAAGSAT